MSRWRAQRRVHLEVRVEAADRLVGERDVVRADFAGERNAARARFAQDADAAGRAEVLAVDGVPVSSASRALRCDDDFLADRRPAGQAEHGAPVAFVHHAFADEIVVLAMVHHDEVEHARVLERAAHDFVVLHAMAVVGERDDAGFVHRADGREFFAGDAFGDRAGREDIHARPRPSPSP